MSTENFKTLHTWDTIYCADSVEWCPISPHQCMFVCGTYHLVKDNDEFSKTEGHQERLGTITLLEFTKETLIQHDQVKISAVLDLKWCGRKINGKILLGSVDSLGNVCVFSLLEEKLNLVAKLCVKKEKGDYLLLSLDWSKKLSEVDTNLCVSDSLGNITLLRFNGQGLIAEKQWNAHSLEAWIVHFDSFNQEIIYSGGDDGKLRVWDAREQSSASLVTSSRHNAGVTALHSHLRKQNYLASGSYDETIFLWDTRIWKQPMEKISAAGGLWRLKWEPKERCRFLLAACIYGGFQIVDSDNFEIVGEYKEHESLAYGADWCFLSEGNSASLVGSERSLISTCSFYDHKLCISTWCENKEVQ